MTEILLDTSILIDLFGKHVTDETKEKLRNSRVCISIVSWYEIIRFFYKTGQVKNLWLVKNRLRQYDLKPLTPDICQKAASASHSENLSMADGLIYASAQANGLRLMTSDSDLKGKPEVEFVTPKE